MGKPTGFREYQRAATPYRDVAARLLDYREIFGGQEEAHLAMQGARCMDCGVPFCQSEDGCPVYNLIPEWNDLIYRGDWRAALDRLQATNNFPEFTGRVCPAPCEGACTLGITDPPVAIKNIEQAIIDRGFMEGWVRPQPPAVHTGKSVAVVGSGPAGLAAAAQLNQAGHRVTVYERADRPGGLLMYGIPNMKLDKEIVHRRLQLLRSEGVDFVLGASVGDGSGGSLDVRDLRTEVDALLLATGATVPRDLTIPGRDLQGIHFAMDFLTTNTRKLLDPRHPDGACLSAAGKKVLVIGGGDTGTDCIGTALRHGCSALVNFEIMPKPPLARAPDNPWPTWPRILRIEYGHEEATHRFNRDPRVYAITCDAFLGDNEGRLRGVRTVAVRWQSGRLAKIPGTEREWEVDLALLAMGFLGPETGVSEPLQVTLDAGSNYLAEYGRYQTNVSKVFAAGDCRRGQSLVVRAIREGREAAREIDRCLMGATNLP